MKVLAAGFRLQMLLVLRTPNFWMVQISTVPSVVIFLSLAEYHEEPQLYVSGVVAAALMSMWATVTWTGGSVVRDDRWEGRLELHVSAPTRYGLVCSARLVAVAIWSCTAVPISLATAVVCYDVSFGSFNGWMLLASTVATVFAMAGAGLVFSALTILTRAASTLQSAVSYPFLILGGVYIPLTQMPEWFQWASQLVFLSWSATSARSIVAEGPMNVLVLQVAAIVILGTLGHLLGHLLIALVLKRVRLTAEISNQ